MAHSSDSNDTEDCPDHFCTVLYIYVCDKSSTHCHITLFKPLSFPKEKFDDDELNEMLEDLKTFKDFQ